MGEILSAVLGADFPKLCFGGGLLLLLIAIFCRRAVKLGPVTLPEIDLAGRIGAGFVGLALISVPVASWVTGTTIGLVKGPEQSASTSIGGKGSIKFGLIGEAYAQESERLLQSIKIEEEHVKRINIGAAELCLYVGDVHLKEPSRLLIFIAKQEYTSKFKEGNRIDYSEIRDAVRKEDIIYYSKVKEGIEATFGCQGKQYRLKVTKVVWYIFGSDFMRIQIFQD
jgi:hypothetical protein